MRVLRGRNACASSWDANALNDSLEAIIDAHKERCGGYIRGRENSKFLCILEELVEANNIYEKKSYPSVKYTPTVIDTYSLPKVSLSTTYSYFFSPDVIFNWKGHEFKVSLQDVDMMIE